MKVLTIQCKLYLMWNSYKLYLMWYSYICIQGLGSKLLTDKYEFLLIDLWKQLLSSFQYYPVTFDMHAYCFYKSNIGEPSSYPEGLILIREP